jgi:hypothetical protein
MMTMIYAINTIPVEDGRAEIFSQIQSGIGCFGWSYSETHNLLRYPESQENTKAKFLLEIKAGDCVVYINMPEYGQCTLARVIGEYFFRDPMEWDFNHCFPIDLESIRQFGRNEDIVPPVISARLKLQGRYWRIYAAEEFNILLQNLETRADGREQRARTLDDNIQYFFDSADAELTQLAAKIHSTHPNFDLEKLMCRVFDKSGKYSDIQHFRGSGDHGADILLEQTIDFVNTISFRQICLVQVKSYKETMDTDAAIAGLRNAFTHHDDAGCGLIVSTAVSITDSFKDKLDAFAEEIKKPVGLLYGKELARFVLRYI